MRRSAGSLPELLLEHGIPERAGRIYLISARAGPQTASELARLAGLHRVEAYRFIRLLEKDGLLRAASGRPARFSALPLEQLVDRWIRGTSDKLERLRSGRDRLLSDWADRLTAPDATDVRKFSILEGRTTIQRFLSRRIAAAEKEILVSVSGFALAIAIDGGVDRALRAAHARGVPIRFVTEVSSRNRDESRHFATFTDLRHSIGPVTNRAVVVDRAGALVYVSGEDGLGASDDDQVAMWSTAPNVLALARGYHQRLWGRAMPFARRILELESPPAASLPIGHGAEGPSFERLREITELGMRVTGLSKIQFDLPEFIQTISRQIGREIGEGIAGTEPASVARSLSEFYTAHAMGRLEVVRTSPLTLRVTRCFACTPQGTEIGRVMCPKILQTALEHRLGDGWSVSAPDPRRHATRGCVFVATPA